MAEPTASRAVVQVSDWPGLATNAGPMAGGEPGAAVEQTNLRANVPGLLAARPGYRKILFDDEG
jgi:hypothetical protein